MTLVKGQKQSFQECPILLRTTNFLPQQRKISQKWSKAPLLQFHSLSKTMAISYLCVLVTRGWELGSWVIVLNTIRRPFYIPSQNSKQLIVTLVMWNISLIFRNLFQIFQRLNIFTKEIWENPEKLKSEPLRN